MLRQIKWFVILLIADARKYFERVWLKADVKAIAEKWDEKKTTLKD